MDKRDELINLISKFIYDNTSEVINEFGSWKSAFDYADINIFKNSKYTDDEIIQLIKKFYKTYGSKASYDTYKHMKLKPSTETIVKKFGSWNNAVKKAGIDIIKEQYKRIDISEDELTSLLNEAKVSIDGKLTIAKYNEWAKENCKVSVWAIIRRHGGWKNALDKANIK